MQSRRGGAHRRQTPTAKFPVALLLLYCCCCCAPLVLYAAGIEVEAPTIEPPSGVYSGEVCVTITRNQPHAYTYYTLDGTTPTDRSDRFVDGAELVLNKPGRHVVRAVSYSKYVPDGGVLTPSEVSVAEYNVTPALLLAPVATPPTSGRQQQRGRVVVTLSLAANTTPSRDISILFLVTYMPTLSTAGTSGALPPPPTSATWQVHVGKGIVLERPGTHIVRARALNTSVTPVVFSPHARFVYRLQQPLMYDVSTECCDDPYQPVVGRPFTVWLSNALAPVSLFLTTSSRGCETGRHILDDTGKMHVSWRQRSFSFVTYTEPQQRVFLCLKEEGLDDYVLVPHRSLIDVANDSAKQFFTIVQGKDGVASTNVSSRQTNPPEVPTPVNAGAHTGSGAEAQWMMLLVVVMLILGASMCVRVNFFAMHTGRNDRRVCRRTQVCEEEREELVPR